MKSEHLILIVPVLQEMGELLVLSLQTGFRSFILA